MTTSDKRELYKLDKIQFVVDLIFVRGSLPASWYGQTYCPICKERIKSQVMSSRGTSKSYLVKRIKSHMREHS